jgi:protein-tyrosine phosphatase
MISSYQGYVIDAAGSFGDALQALATAEGAILVHCTAGKDRTGFLVAVIQTALGVSDETVRADYLRTNSDWDRASVAGRLPLDDEAVEAILVADLDYLDTAFEAIARRDGSVDAFIHRATRGHLGLEGLAHLIEQDSQP